MIRLYTAQTPNGRKISIALEELEMPYEVEHIQLDKEQQLTEEFLALNPNHKIPVIDDGGLVIWESGAILLHLGEKYGKILSTDPKRRMDAIQYAFFQTGGIGPNMGRLGAAVRKPEAERNTEMIQIFGGEVGRLCGVLERILDDDRDYLAGDYSIGDIMHYPWLRPLLDLKAPQITERKKVVAWMNRMAARPAVQKGMSVP